MLPFGPDCPVCLGPDLVAAGFEIDTAAGSSDPLPVTTAIESTGLSSIVVDVLPGFTLRLIEGLWCREGLESDKEK